MAPVSFAMASSAELSGDDFRNLEIKGSTVILNDHAVDGGNLFPAGTVFKVNHTQIQSAEWTETKYSRFHQTDVTTKLGEIQTWTIRLKPVSDESGSGDAGLTLTCKRGVDLNQKLVGTPMCNSKFSVFASDLRVVK